MLVLDLLLKLPMASDGSKSRMLVLPMRVLTKYLHVTTKTEHEMERRLMPDVIV